MAVEETIIAVLAFGTLGLLTIAYIKALERREQRKRRKMEREMDEIADQLAKFLRKEDE